MASVEQPRMKEGFACMRQPSLIKQLKSVLDQYPKGQILKEMMQNAEDAGAREIKVLYEGRQCNRTEDLAKLENPSHLKALQGPGLCVFNDAKFTEKDWEGIQMIQCSNKEQDRLKVGRYGLGFKSVFHVTDWLCIISGEWILFINPYQPRDEVCLLRKMATYNLDTNILQALSNLFEGTFGFSNTCLQNGYYDGTLFWFPLRQRKSELSENVYTEEDIMDLFKVFVTEAKMTLLFLRSLESISLFQRDDFSAVQNIFVVQIAKQCLQSLRQQREQFKLKLDKTGDNLPVESFHSTFHLSIEHTEFSQLFQFTSQDWIVVNFYKGGSMSELLQHLCDDRDLSYSPYVGIAYPLTHPDQFKGHIFCFLPLPLSSESITGLPVHVNGFFALTQDRREVKWSADDGKQDQWNHCLISEVISEAYIVLIEELRKHCQRNNNSSDVIEFYYGSLPDYRKVTAQWRCLIQPFYQALYQTKAFFSKVGGGTWIHWKKVILAKYSGDIEHNVCETVTKVYLEYQQNIVQLPDHIVDRIKTHVPCVSPDGLCCLLKTSDLYMEYTPAELMHLLKYALRSSSHTSLEGLGLLPLADGTFQKFSGREIFFCPLKVDIFPGLQRFLVKEHLDRFIQQQIARMANEGYNKLREVNAKVFPRLVKACININFPGNGGTVVLQSPSPTLGETWLRKLWSLARELRVDMQYALLECPLVPVFSGKDIKLHCLRDQFIAKSHVGFDTLPEDISQCVQQLGGVVLPHVPDYIQAVLPLGACSVIQFPTPQGVINLLRHASQKNIEYFNKTAQTSMKTALVKYVATCTDIAPEAKMVLRQLRLFTDTLSSKQNSSIADLDKMAPIEQIPVAYPTIYLCGKSPISRSLAIQLGAQEISMFVIIYKILSIMASAYQKQYSTKDVQTFMVFLFVNNPIYLNNGELSQKASEIQFVPSCKKGKLHRAKDLFDPGCSFLQELLYGEDKFPKEEFCQIISVSDLKMLGLKSEHNITVADIYHSVSVAESVFNQFAEPERIRKKGKAILIALETCDVTNMQITELFSCRWMPVLVQRPSTYPEHLPFAGSNEYVTGRPKDMYHFMYLNLVGSVRAVTMDTLSNKIATLFQNPPEEVVLKHLNNIINTYTADEHQKYMIQLYAVYRHFSSFCLSQRCQIQLATMKVVWVGEDREFVEADKIWINHSPSDVDLAPYRYPLLKSLKLFSSFFSKIGASQHQTSKMLMDVLYEIQEKHGLHADRMSVLSDMSLVMMILNVLKEDKSVDKKQILIPVYNREGYIILKKAENCIYCDSYQDADVEGDACENYFAKITSELAGDLGIRMVANPYMDATEEIDMNYGQTEPLTRRLRNLLHEYTDGFSVPKEIIQNADDAGASEVNFLYDERENLDARSSLINKGMASLQGPALWAQNDAQFSESDFMNIIKLSGETKMDDSTKIGRFGLGFNAVYNLTDVPSFISGNTIVILDPHKSYLGSPGIKADLTKEKNKVMLHKLNGQFKPFQGVFGCDMMQHSSQKGYSGTLFRFPLRTQLQAQQSDISELYYSSSEMEKFLQMFVGSAGNVLLFCQNVKTVRLYHLPKNISDASKATPLVEVRKNIQQISSQLSGSVLQIFTAIWNEKCHSKRSDTSDAIYEMINISLSVFIAANKVCNIAPTVSKVSWIIAWVLGRKESAKMAMTKTLKGLLPIAAAAVPLRENQGHVVLLPLSDCPQGFYKEGHLFCFLPLPITIPLPLHINGAFAVTHDRKQLCCRSEDEKSLSSEARWNEVLHLDAVSFSVIRVLEALKMIGDVDPTSFYELWPGSELQYGTLVKQFHKIVVYENPEVLLYNEKWSYFQNAVFLDPQLRFEKSVGHIAFTSFEYFYKGRGIVIDLPEKIINGFIVAGLNAELKSHTLNFIAFYEDIFFPNISDPYWNNEDRDCLVVYALQHGNAKVKSLLKKTPCIPTRPTGTLRRPADLVHPNGKTSNLFKDLDGVFPLNSKTSNFCTAKILSVLTDLGMQNNELQWSVVYERVTSIEKLCEESMEDAVKRCKYILYYLEEPHIHVLHGITRQMNRFMTCPDEFKNKIQSKRFLPIRQKPHNWPTVWCCNSKNKYLETPCSLCFEECVDIACSNFLVLDATSLDLSQTRKVLKWLGVHSKYDIPASKVAEHLLMVATTQMVTLDTAAYRKLSSMCSTIYFHLDHLFSSENNSETSLVFEMLHSKPVILQDKAFIRPQQMAFSMSYDLKPYLYKVDSSLVNSFFLRTIGVRDSFEPIDAANIMIQIADSCEGNALSDTQLHCYSNAASFLVDLIGSNEHGYVGKIFYKLILPDKRGVLHPFSELCLDDCEWLSEINSMKFLHHVMSVKVAVAFGIKTKRQEDLKSHSVPFIKSFGQHEALTNRLKRILDGYPCDTSLMKELLQNADDAGATELMFIKDFRKHPCNRIFDDRWKSLQGPALCVYNNGYFTQKDLNGIQNLGLGSKGGDPLKTGQYGVGFNAVYHLTDVPTFLTVGPETEETFCVLDPNCLYTPTAEPGVPGARFDNIAQLRTSYRDVFSCFLENQIELHPQGTLFRFPLRTEEMAKTSGISKKAICTSEIENLIKSFSCEMAESLLFLHNVRKISVAFINEKGHIEIEHAVEASTSEENSQKCHRFLNNLELQVTKTRTLNKGLKNIKQEQILVTLKLKSSQKQDEQEWLVIHQFGFSAHCDLPLAIDSAWTEGRINMLPRGGVAARLDEREAKCDKKAFCMLPLPIKTGLPVHINGHFALDHEARRNLWHGTSDVRSLWNKLMVEALIVPSYLRALKQMQVFGDVNLERVQQLVHMYNTWFPDGDKTTDEFWKSLVIAFYKTVFHYRQTLFPVINVHKKSDLVKWVSVSVGEGFPGYFNDLESYFNNAEKNKVQHNPESLTFGSVYRSMKNLATSASHLVYTSTNEVHHYKSKALKLAALLKRIGMKVIEAPLWIYNNFVLADLGNAVHTVDPENVITFLKSCRSEATDICFVGQLPQRVFQTPLCDTATVRFLIKFCQKSKTFHAHIVGLPLCLTNSSLLQYFRSEDPILVTKFTDLIQGSPDTCLHKDVADLFLKSSQCPAIKQMDIRDLSQLLDKTLDAAEFKQGIHVVWNNTEKQPTKKWIKTLWTFLSTELKKEFSEGSLSFSNFQELKEWSLLPCSVIRENKDIRQRKDFNYLYPIEKAAFVVNLQTGTSRKVVAALQAVGLPCFNPAPFEFDVDVAHFASFITANLQNPYSLLVALSGHKHEKIQSVEIACTLLEYFCDDLKALQSVKNEAIKMLKALPYFVTLSRSTMPMLNRFRPVLVADRYPCIPMEGLDDWSSQTGITIFQFQHQLKDLYTFMSITALTPECFYSQNLLPQFQFLPREAKAVHLKHIKDNLLKPGFGKERNADETELIDTLQTLPFIETKDGTLCKASEFFSIMENVFRVMCPPTVFPPSPYNSLEWHDFLVLAGMINKVSVNHFVRFANEVHILGKQIITTNVASMSSTLVKHLFGRPNLLQENLLSQIKHIKFVLPFCMKDQHKHGKTLDCIHEQYESGSQLIAFNGSVSFRSCYLVWSSCTLFPEMPHLDKKIFFQLGCQNIPQKDDVIIHLKNISCSLQGKPVPVEFKTCLEEIMFSCYKYLQENGVTEHDKQYLEAYPVIYLNASRCMVRACDIVINLAKEDAIPGYIYQSPVYFGLFFDVFEKLGASTIVSANHYAKVLLEKHLDIGEHKLDPNEWKVVQKAVAMLFTCLSDNRYSKELSVSKLYLPSSKETLVCSKDLVLSNCVELQMRILSLNLTYFIGFKTLKIPAVDPVRTVCYLPQKHRPSILTSLVQEHVTAECKEQAYHGTHSNKYLHCMSTTPFISGVIRLANHQSYYNYSTPITEEKASLIAKIFQNIQICEVYDLRTNLVYSELPVAGSEQKVTCFSEFSPTKDRNILYLDTDACENNFDMCYQISDEIDKMVKGQIGKKINCITQMLQIDGNAISLYLDKQKILASDFDIYELDKVIFPPPGTLIPLEFHWMLNNNFESLKVDEYVGLEVYDPLVNETLSSTPSMESSDAVYIYAIVRKITEQNVSPMMSKYCVEVGEGRMEELNATKLYKFCRHKTSSSRELVLSSAPSSSPPRSPGLNDVLKEIRQTLKDAWLHFDEHDRQRVVKRLYLKWHPDKNDPGRQQLCTNVCQYIQLYVTKLNRGENIDDNEEKHSWSPRPPFESSDFFTNMDRRSRSQRNCYNSYQQHSGHHSSSSSNTFGFHSFTRENAYPHHGEARRWLRQAAVDLDAAKKGLSNTLYDAFNWICFKSHQAAEKALKALLYNHDARLADEIRSHDLRSVMQNLQVSFIHDLSDSVCQLENLVRDYNRMRYPDRLSFPQIPSDVYSRDTACNACCLAGDIVQYAERQIC